MVRCLRCPIAYHSGDGCIAAGSLFVSSHILICSNHSKRSNHSSSAVNVGFCFVCARGELCFLSSSIYISGVQSLTLLKADLLIPPTLGICFCFLAIGVVGAPVSTGCWISQQHFSHQYLLSTHIRKDTKGGIFCCQLCLVRGDFEMSHASYWTPQSFLAKPVGHLSDDFVLSFRKYSFSHSFNR